MDDLKGRVALVTGAGRGLGRAAALALAAEDAHVAVNFRRREADAKETLHRVQNGNSRGMLYQADVSRSKEVFEMVQAVERDLGPVDILVNNAGIIRPQPLEQISERDWDELIAVNLKSAFLCSQAVLPGMRKRRWGRIINVASLAAQVGGLVGPHYSASKAGLLGLTHCYASLLVKEGITVNAVNPALIESEMLFSNPRARPEMVPVGRFGKPEEFASVIVMLARNGYITGQSVSVNGGMYFT